MARRSVNILEYQSSIVHKTVEPRILVCSGTCELSHRLDIAELAERIFSQLDVVPNSTYPQ
jgi:hypothetical protein